MQNTLDPHGPLSDYLAKQNLDALLVNLDKAIETLQSRLTQTIHGACTPEAEGAPIPDELKFLFYNSSIRSQFNEGVNLNKDYYTIEVLKKIAKNINFLKNLEEFSSHLEEFSSLHSDDSQENERLLKLSVINTIILTQYLIKTALGKGADVDNKDVKATKKVLVEVNSQINTITTTLFNKRIKNDGKVDFTIAEGTIIGVGVGFASILPPVAIVLLLFGAFVTIRDLITRAQVKNEAFKLASSKLSEGLFKDPARATPDAGLKAQDKKETPDAAQAKKELDSVGFFANINREIPIAVLDSKTNVRSA